MACNPYVYALAAAFLLAADVDCLHHSTAAVYFRVIMLKEKFGQSNYTNSNHSTSLLTGKISICSFKSLLEMWH